MIDNLKKGVEIIGGHMGSWGSTPSFLSFLIFMTKNQEYSWEYPFASQGLQGQASVLWLLHEETKGQVSEKCIDFHQNFQTLVVHRSGNIY